MTVYGIVCECNPFHRGHQRILSFAREQGADAVVGVMSGDLVQRGEPAVISKYLRAEQMVRSGFDLVIELPVRFVLSSAQRFASAGVNLLADTGAADVLLFGSECGSLDALTQTACLIETEDCEKEIRLLQQEGYSYPAAREKAVRNRLGDMADCLIGGNDQLGIEYLRALRKNGSRMMPVILKREDDGFSAHAARALLEEGASASGLLPDGTDTETLFSSRVDRRMFGHSVLMKLREMDQEDFSQLDDITGGLDMRLYRASRSAASYEEMLNDVKTKRYTMSRIKRVALCAALQLRSSPDERPPYARILAIGRNGRDVLARMKERSVIPFGDSIKTLAAASTQAEMCAGEECRATDFYNLNLTRPLPVGEDFTHKLFVIQ